MTIIVIFIHMITLQLFHIIYMHLFSFLLLITTFHAQILQIKKKGLKGNKQCHDDTENNQTAISIGNCQQSIYYIQLGIGTPPQFLNFELDTTSELMWLSISEDDKKFNSSTIEIEHKTTTVDYRHLKSVQGYPGSDYVTIEDTNVSTRSAILWLDESVQNLFQPQISGIVGMSYSEFPNFLDSAYLKGQIESPVFSLSMQRGEGTSIIYYNILPESITKNTRYVPVVGSGLWKAKLKGFKANKQDLSYYVNNTIVFDSRADRVKLDSNLLNVLAQQYFKDCNHTKKFQFIYCPCARKFPTFSFILDDLQVFLHPHSYVKNIEGDKCLIQISQSDEIVFGDIFFKEYVITFDKIHKRIGFMGDVLPVHFIGNEYFELSQYILMSLLLFQIGFGLYLLYFLRLQKIKEKTAKNINLSTSFIELP